MQNYEGQEVIGQGQYGTAFKARHKLDGQLYCIKRIGMSAKDDQTGALKEVQMLSSLDHPNVIAYKESFIDPKDGALCIVTSYCEDGDLFNKIRKRQTTNELFSETEVMDMFVQIASSLMHIHSKRILHRDLKTQNIFVARGNIMKMGDFGISKVLEKTDQFATTVTGTPYYMAPEICTNQPYTFKSDIWSLGCVLYELCTLKHAFAADSLLSLVYSIVRGNFPPIPTNQFSQGLSNLVNSLLVREPNQRPSLADIFAMPYVQEHVHRYRQEEKRSLVKHSNTMARRRQLLEKTADGSPGANTTIPAADDSALTPKQKVVAKKDQERQRRELELKLAGFNAVKEQGVATQRKMANIAGSNAHGLPGASSTPAPASRPGDSTFLDPGANAISAGSTGFHRITSIKRGGDNNPWNLDDTDVNFGTVVMGTMPAANATASAANHTTNNQGHGTTNNQGYGSTNNQGHGTTHNQGHGDSGGGAPPPFGRMASLRRAPPPGTPGRQTLEPAGNSLSAFDMYENRPIRNTTPRGRQSTDSDDAVLMGTVGSNGHTMGTTTATQGGVYNVLGRPGPWGMDQPIQARPSFVSVTSITSPLPRPGILSSPPPPPPSNIVGGFRFGVTNPASLSALPAFPVPLHRSISPPIQNQRPSSASAKQRSITGKEQYQSAQGPQSGSGYEDYDEGGDDYDDDFEDYHEPTDQETINQKCQILNNMEAIEKTKGRVAGLMDDSISQVKDKVATMTKASKAAALRDRCQAELGFHFPDVYTYLRRVRTQETSTDELTVQRQLQELVGRDRALLQGCFLVDQLVFQETLYR